jgi:hypothetical protein
MDWRTAPIRPFPIKTKELVMSKKFMLTVVVAGLGALCLPAKVCAYGAAHVGYTHVGPNGAYHVGGTEVRGGYGGGEYRGGAAYGGTEYRGGAAYGGTEYRGGAAYGGAAYGGYHYTAGYAGGTAGGDVHSNLIR